MSALVARVMERGADTTSRVSLEELGLQQEGYRDYEPSGWMQLRRALRGIDVGRDDVFLDLGCGKGRVVRQAMRYPFARVIGLELSTQLADEAREVVAGHKGRAGSVEIVAADAMTWPVPDDVTVVYFYNSFFGEPLVAALDQIAASLDRRPRRLVFAYAHPNEERTVLDHPRFELVERRGKDEWWAAADPRRITIFRGVPAVQEQPAPVAETTADP